MITIPRRSLGESIISRSRWYIFVRWFVIIALTVPGVLSSLPAQGAYNNLGKDLHVIAIALSSNLIFYLLSLQKNRSERFFRLLAASMLIFDTLLITYFIYTKGGIESRSVILYTGPILLTAALFNSRAIFYTAAFAIFCYDGLIIAVHNHILKRMGEVNPTYSERVGYVFNTVIFMSATLLIITVIAHYMSRLLQQEQQLVSESLNGLKRAQQIANLGSWEYDAVTQKTMWTDVMYKIFNRNVREGPMMLEQLLPIVYPSDRKELQKKIQRAMVQQYSFSMNYRLQFPRKPMRYVHAEIRSMTDRYGRVKKLYGIVHDITEFKRLDDAKSDFVSLVSHQLRTPATVVKQHLGILLEGYVGPLQNHQKEELEKAYQGNERQLKIIDDLLRIARLESGKLILHKMVVDIVSLVQMVVEDYSSNFDPKVEKLVFYTKQKTLFCYIDPEYIRMALENIIDNATKYSDGSVDITVRLVKSKDMARIIISDKGIGIENGELQTIFQKFYRTHNQKSIQAGGSGLGLYWVSQVLEMHKGKVEVSSKLGKGSEFTLCIPQNLPPHVS